MTRNQSGAILLDVLIALTLVLIFGGITIGARVWALMAERKALAFYDCVMYVREVYDAEYIRLVTSGGAPSCEKLPGASYAPRNGVRIMSHVALCERLPDAVLYELSVIGIPTQGEKWELRGFVRVVIAPEAL